MHFVLAVVVILNAQGVPVGADLLGGAANMTECHEKNAKWFAANQNDIGEQQDQGNKVVLLCFDPNKAEADTAPAQP